MQQARSWPTTWTEWETSAIWSANPSILGQGMGKGSTFFFKCIAHSTFAPWAFAARINLTQKSGDAPYLRNRGFAKRFTTGVHERTHKKVQDNNNNNKKGRSSFHSNFGRRRLLVRKLAQGGNPSRESHSNFSGLPKAQLRARSKGHRIFVTEEMANQNSCHVCLGNLLSDKKQLGLGKWSGRKSF